MVTAGETREYLKERDVLSILSLFHDHKAPTIVAHAEAAAVAPAAKQEEPLDIRTSYLQRHELDAAHLQPLFALPDGVALVLGFVSPDLSLDDVAASIKHELPSDDDSGRALPHGESAALSARHGKSRGCFARIIFEAHNRASLHHEHFLAQ